MVRTSQAMKPVAGSERRNGGKGKGSRRRGRKRNEEPSGGSRDAEGSNPIQRMVATGCQPESKPAPSAEEACSRRT
jgi:hypothetical protein